MRMEIARLHQELGATMIYVTHDQVEAMTLADKIVVLDQGEVQQVGSPLQLYHKPANLFVAGSIGSPKMNHLRVRLKFAHEVCIRGDVSGPGPRHASRSVRAIAGFRAHSSSAFARRRCRSSNPRLAPLMAELPRCG